MRVSLIAATILLQISTSIAEELSYGSDEDVFLSSVTFKKAISEVENMQQQELASFTEYLVKCRAAFSLRSENLDRECREARLRFLITYNQDRAIDRVVQSIQSIANVMKSSLAGKDRSAFDKYLRPSLDKEGDLCRAANRRFRSLAQVPTMPADRKYASGLCYTD